MKLKLHTIFWNSLKVIFLQIKKLKCSELSMTSNALQTKVLNKKDLGMEEGTFLNSLCSKTYPNLEKNEISWNTFDNLLNRSA